MQRGLSVFFSIFLILVVLIASGAIYTVDETKMVVLTQFGKLIGKPKLEAGLNFKIPFVQKANYFEKRLLQWDGDANQMPTGDKRFIWVDTTARWKITDPLVFMQSVGSEPSAQSRLDDIIDASTRAVISGHNLVEIIRTSNRLIEENELTARTEIEATALEPVKLGRENLTRKILERSSEAVSNYGIELVDVRIKRINYVNEVQREVYQRMIKEREGAAQEFRSEGIARRAEIDGEIEKQAKLIHAEAYKKSQEIRGAADAKAIKIYADAYNKDPDFYTFIKTLESYPRTINKDTTMILSTGNEFYEHINGIKGFNKVSQ